MSELEIKKSEILFVLSTLTFEPSYLYFKQPMNKVRLLFGNFYRRIVDLKDRTKPAPNWVIQTTMYSKSRL